MRNQNKGNIKMQKSSAQQFYYLVYKITNLINKNEEFI